jgi:hypothetical protein
VGVERKSVHLRPTHLKGARLNPCCCRELKDVGHILGFNKDTHTHFLNVPHADVDQLWIYYAAKPASSLFTNLMIFYHSNPMLNTHNDSVIVHHFIKESVVT